MARIIRFGAQDAVKKALLGGEQDITGEQEQLDKSIDEILQYGKKRTKEINDELSKIESKFNLNNISLTGEDANHDQNLYKWEGEDYTKFHQNEVSDIFNFLEKL
jgi:hypothetical protein